MAASVPSRYAPARLPRNRVRRPWGLAAACVSTLVVNLWTAIGYAIAALLMFILILTIPFGASFPRCHVQICFRIDL